MVPRMVERVCQHPVQCPVLPVRLGNVAEGAQPCDACFKRLIPRHRGIDAVACEQIRSLLL